LSYNPAGCEGIEPSLRVLEARPVTMTLHPKISATRIEEEVIAPIGGHASIEAEAFGIEPMYSTPRIRRWRPVGESNPSHPIDSGAATPVALRAINKLG